MQMKRVRQNEKVAPTSRDVPHVSDRERIATLVRTARERLEPYAKIPDAEFNCMSFSKKIMSSFNSLGGFDGVGVAMKIASFDVESSETEVSRFLTEGSVLIESMQAALLNYGVLLSLFLTVYMSLVMQHATRSYDIEANPSLEGHRGGEAMYADFASFAYPHDLDSQRICSTVREHCSRFVRHVAM